MSDELDKKIKQIADMLGQDGVPDSLKGLLGILSGSNDKAEPLPKSSDSNTVREGPEKSDLDENLEMMRRMKWILDRVRSNNDPRINLLSSIKPFLNNRRQKRVGNCIKFLQMTGLTRHIEDFDKANS